MIGELISIIKGGSNAAIPSRFVEVLFRKPLIYSPGFFLRITGA
jgi:hypothetical protein